MNRVYSLAAAAALLLLCTLPGCQAPLRRPPQPTQVHDNAAKNLLFNPQFTIASGCDLARSDWPVTEAFEHQREDFSYRETIFDFQGRFGANQDYAYRRFASIRTGSTRC